MRAIAAWLALWDDAVCQELTKREPETLLALGDPETLSITVRSNLVRNFVATYGQGGWRGLDIPIDQIRRLADPDLAPVIRECWGNGSVSGEVRELLLEIIWLGPVYGCADLADAVARDPTQPHNHRISAIRALIACDRNDAVRKLAGAMLTEPASWPNEIVHGLAAELFPRFITIDGLVTLMERTQEPKQTIGGFEWASRQIAEAIEPQTELAASLRNGLADLIWRGRQDSTGPYSVRSGFDYLAPALAKLCNRQLSWHAGACSDDLVRACVIASRFGNNVTDVEKSIENLRAHFNSDPALRSEAFWAELAFMDEIAPDTDDWDRYHHAKQNSLMGYLTEADRPWLEAGLANESRPERRAVALHALISIWRQGGRKEFDLNVIRGHLKGEATLVAILEERTAPPTPEQEAASARHEAWHQQQDEDQAREEATRLREEEALRGYLLTNADEAFSPGNRKRNVVEALFLDE